MIRYTRGNLLDAKAEALVNTVNTVGVMGKGIALQFKQAFPGNYEAYRKAAKAGQVVPGRMFVHETGHLTGPKFIINFPTKRHWKGASRVSDIEDGLVDLARVIQELGVRSVAVPPLGCGNGGLEWSVVRPRIESALGALPHVDVEVFEPVGAPEASSMPVHTARPRMTAGRAALVGLLRQYAEPGYALKLLEIQKLSYFLQEAGESLRLQFAKRQYGPYAANLEHALQRMEGHLIRGYGDRSRSASVYLLPGAAEEADEFLADHPSTSERFLRVADLIQGFETPYGLELLATVHWVAREDARAAADPEAAVVAVHEWSDRKRLTFRETHIRRAWQRLAAGGWLRPESPASP